MSLLLVVAIGMFACSPVKVITDQDKSADLTKYGTYSFFNLTDKGPGLSPLNRDRIINAINDEMKKKGYVETAANPDIMVNATTIVNEKKQVTTTNFYNYGGLYRPYFWGPTMGSMTYDVTELKEGSLVIDIVDASTKKLVWQSTGNREIDLPMKKADKIIPESVQKILAGFPAKSK
jgi:hypothetical protein